MLHQTAFTPNTFYAKPLVRQVIYTRNLFKPNNMYTRNLLRQTTFTPDTFYKATFTPNTFYAKRLVHQTTFRSDASYTKQFLHRKPVALGTFCACCFKNLLRQAILTPQRSCIKHRFTPSVTPNTFYTRNLKNHTSFTPNSFYTRILLRQTPFAPATFYTKQILQTSDTFYTKQVLHQKTSQTKQHLHKTAFTAGNFYTRHRLV